jgi:hypothetical protein
MLEGRNRIHNEPGRLHALCHEQFMLDLLDIINKIVSILTATLITLVLVWEQCWALLDPLQVKQPANLSLQNFEKQSNSYEDINIADHHYDRIKTATYEQHEQRQTMRQLIRLIPSVWN